MSGRHLPGTGILWLLMFGWFQWSASSDHPSVTSTELNSNSYTTISQEYVAMWCHTYTTVLHSSNASVMYQVSVCVCRISTASTPTRAYSRKFHTTDILTGTPVETQATNLDHRILTRLILTDRLSSSGLWKHFVRSSHCKGKQKAYIAKVACATVYTRARLSSRNLHMIRAGCVRYPLWFYLFV